MKRFFDDELDAFRSRLIKMGNLAIDQVRTVMAALLDHDTNLAAEVRRKDDEIDDLEVEIDSEAIRYISLRNPVASDLRLIIVGMKASHDLERVGDEATNIAKRIPVLAGEKPIKDYIDLPRMADIALEMLQDALDSFLNGDDVKALEIVKRDEKVDELNKQVYRELTSYIQEKPSSTTLALELMFISRSLERIADHATNIAEEVIYLTKGKDIRHSELTKKTPPETR